MKLTNEVDGWRLVLQRGVVQLIQIDFRLGLFLNDAPDNAKLYIAEDCLLKSPNFKHTLSLEDPLSLAPILAFVGAKVAGVSIGKTGQLRLEFESGSSLEVGSNDFRESWELNSSIGVMMICSPGGSISLFGDGQISGFS